MTLVMADIHLGIEVELSQFGLHLPDQTQKILNRILGYILERNPDRVVLLGDIKHNIPQVTRVEEKGILALIEQISKHTQVEIIPGNHDGRIRDLLPDTPNVILHGTGGAVIDGVGYFHGHAWPSEEVLEAEHLIMGHNHPVIQFKDTFGYTIHERVWIRAKCEFSVLKDHYPSLQSWKDPCCMIMPAFNELCGGITFNAGHEEDLLGPMTSRVLRIDEAEVYLLDGTFIGRIGDVKGDHDVE
ncbi:MAG TPA: metallophosphoesterase [Candidatus Syntrophoarchaeum butanivorans]|uniref:Metallophosphoesterase n=1 Tax=Candidatus Syntropharchaeum butanivorans TaxID=1839936 RepID=A0A1F2P7E2_9EURY|nr:MAG: phosphoesterase, ICC [Candidatus Syntrophoarchaeum butanivorans]HDM37037.1 metallophosphoesterase [Candidatus Syntrophoarchaeum butanivorans]HEC57516.1 metallophosphoesterase [Candidatus Syntrophoarchaeum butanivorans]